MFSYPSVYRPRNVEKRALVLDEMGVSMRYVESEYSDNYVLYR